MNKLIKLLLLAICLFLITGCSFPKGYICIDIKPSGLEINKIGDNKYEVEDGSVKFKIGECDSPKSETKKEIKEEPVQNETIKEEVINETINISETPENNTVLE